MSAVANIPVSDFVSIEIDGVATQAKKGSMIIEAADKLGIAIPRFCYHSKLPIAANCRTCLVDVEKAPKPMPACATPVMEGMKVFTQSKRALDSQRNVMEFILINHPLDCPICDQGGECELQDVAMGFGRSVSRFSERKRVVADENLGSLVATDMTRCIHCTRCVRFVTEIAGTYELGGLGRGENLEIGTYIGKSLESELSGNIIDVCPVGALTNKPFRYKARAWELTARESIGYHDALGSNLYLHTRRGEVLRSVPRSNEAVNECWLSDRDRYSHTGLRAEDRVAKPLIRINDSLQEVEWELAIAHTASLLKARIAEHGADHVGVLVGPATSNEEGHLLKAISQALNIENIDHRIRIRDFADAPVAQAFAMPLEQIEEADSVFIIGANPRLEAPLLGHRIRKAKQRGAKVFALNALDYSFNYDLNGKIIAAPSALIAELAGVAAAIAELCKVAVPENLRDVVAGAKASDTQREIAAAIHASTNGLLLTGEVAIQHAQASVLRALATFIASAGNAKFNEIPQGANSVGLAQVGVLPSAKGLNAAQVLAQPRKTLVIYNAELPLDAVDAQAATGALLAAEMVIAFTAFADDALRQRAAVILPIGLLPEIDATLSNADGLAQQVHAGAKLPDDARAGWRVLRALGESLAVSGFDFVEMSALREQIELTAVANSAASTLNKSAAAVKGLEVIATSAIYRVDAVTRRAEALQKTPLAHGPRAAINAQEAKRLNVQDAHTAKVVANGVSVETQIHINNNVPNGCVWIETGYAQTAALAITGTGVEISATSKAGATA